MTGRCKSEIVDDIMWKILSLVHILTADFTGTTAAGDAVYAADGRISDYTGSTYADFVSTRHGLCDLKTDQGQLLWIWNL